MARSLLLALPAATVALAAFSLLGIAAPRPVVGVRLLGGPTDAPSPLTCRLEAERILGEAREGAAGLPLRVTVAGADGTPAAWEGTLDDEGRAEVVLALPARLTTPLTAEVTSPALPRPLARGSLSLPRERWWGRRHERGGTLPVPSTGELTLRVTPARGALAVPFPAPLLVEVRDPSGPVAHARLSAQVEGAVLLAAPDPTNARGRTVLTLRPRTTTPSLELRAEAPSGATGRWSTTLSVVAGALDARLPTGSAREAPGPWRLELRSPVPRARAFYALIDERGRRGGGSVALSPGDDGTASGSATLPPPRLEHGWLVVSSEPDLASPGAVGWPLEEPTAAWLAGRIDAAPRSVTLPETPLLDGVVAAEAAERARRSSVRRWTAWLVVTALALVLLLFLRDVGRAGARLDRELRAAAGVAVAAGLVRAPRQRWLDVAIAALTIAFGFLVLVLLAGLRAP